MALLSTQLSNKLTYNPFTLSLYDGFVHKFSNKFAWLIESDRLREFFVQYLSENHLDIGVGTGYFWQGVDNSDRSICLLDINPASLAYTSSQLGSALTVRTIQHNIFQVFPSDCHNAFASISAFYLLHCLPSSQQETALQHIASCLSERGVFYGTSIAGSEHTPTKVNRVLLPLYNHLAIFDNLTDNVSNIKASLTKYFHKVEVWQEGNIIFFVAGRPMSYIATELASESV